MEKQNFTIEKTAIECYKIRHESGMYWADIAVDSFENKGRISISSDYGNYANYWGDCGCNFKEFLTELNLEYAADKLNADRWFDLDCTLKGYRIRVLECRRDEILNSELAREIWNEIEGLEECSSESEFVSDMWNKSKLMRFFDNCPDIDYGITPQFRQFWKTIWPIFINQIKSELTQKSNLI